MKLYFKYIIFFFLICFFYSDFTFAQRSESEQSEIIMRQSELDSFLLKLVRHKKEQMAKQRKSRQLGIGKRYDSLLHPEQKRKIKKGSDEASRYSEERIYNEFAWLNNRIDWLILNMSGGRTVSVPSGNISVPGGDPNVIYIQPGSHSQQQPFSPGLLYGQADHGANVSSGRPGEVERSGFTDSEVKTEETYKPSEEEARLQSQIADLTEKVRVLDQLGETTQSKEYDDEITGLNARIEELQTNLEESQRLAAAEREERERSKLDEATLKELREYSLNIYFANNSTSLGSSDVIALEELAETMKKYEQNLTVVLHGFASKSGSAAYNNKISFERAESVKNVLRKNGVRARNIVTLPHGVDDTGKAEHARRVEVSLRVL